MTEQEQDNSLDFGGLVKCNLLKNSTRKQIWVVKNTSSNCKFIAKFQPITKMAKIKEKSIYH
jgi:hypothetical protein